MLAAKLKGQITPNRKLIVEIPRDMAPGAVEVIVLHDAPVKAAKITRRKTDHPAFGLWAKRTNLIDSADYAAQLRQQIEQRADQHGWYYLAARYIHLDRHLARPGYGSQLGRLVGVARARRFGDYEH